MNKKKQEWLFQLRWCRSKEILEKVINAINYKLSDNEFSVFYCAADHWLAELRMDRLFDKVSASVWKYIR